MRKTHQMPSSVSAFSTALKRMGIAVERLNVSVRVDPMGQANVEVLSSRFAECDYAVKLVPDSDVFVVWDCVVRRRHGGPSGCYLSGADFIAARPCAQSFSDVYKQLRPHGQTVGYEKVMVVGADHFQAFFENLDDYMRINPYDENYLPLEGRMALGDDASRNGRPDDGDSDSAGSRASRERRSTKYFLRDYRFRQRVLDYYGSRCAICRLDVVEALDAAHRHGRTVAEGDYFETKDGVCLCASHHRMYDRDLFQIDFSTGELVDLVDGVAAQDWYRDFRERFDGRITMPR